MPQADFERIDIRQFVFHHLARDAEGRYQATYLPPFQLGPRPKAFFERLIRKHCQTTKYVFVNGVGADGQPVPESPVKTACEEICRDGNLFADRARTLTADFVRTHRPGTSEGILIVARFLAGDPGTRNLIALMKYDNESAFRYTLDGQEPNIEEVTNALSQHPESIMKVAIVDTLATDGWQVLAKDRQHRKPGGIADYFRDYLGVKEVGSPEKSTRDVVDLTQNWASAELADQTPIQQAEYQHRAVDYFRTQPAFGLDSFLDYVVGPADTDERAAIRGRLEAYLRERDFAHEFPSRPAGLKKVHTRQIFKTYENVEIIMPNGPRAGNVTCTTDEATGQAVITIRSRSVSTLRPQ